MRRFDIALSIALISVLQPAFAQKRPASPTDTCTVELSVPNNTTVTADGRNYGTKRELIWTTVAAGWLFPSTLSFHFPDGRTEDRTVLLEAGRKLRVSLQRPTYERPRLEVPPSRLYRQYFPNFGNDVLIYSDHELIFFDCVANEIRRRVSCDQLGGLVEDGSKILWVRAHRSELVVMCAGNYGEGSLVFIDIRTGKPVGTARRTYAPFLARQPEQGFDMSTDGKLYLTIRQIRKGDGSATGSQLEVRDVVSDAIVAIRRGTNIDSSGPLPDGTVDSAAFIPNTHDVLVGCWGEAADPRHPRLSARPFALQWSPEQDRVTKQFMLSARQLWNCVPNDIRFSSDGTSFVTFGQAYGEHLPGIQKCCVWNRDGSLRYAFPIDSFKPENVVLSRDLRLVAMVEDVIKSEVAGKTSSTISNQVLAMRDGKSLRKLNGTPTSFLKDDRLLAIDIDGGTILYDVMTGAEVLRQVWPTGIGEKGAGLSEWLVVTPEGLFDGSARARQQVSFSINDGQTRVPVDRFFSDFYYPGLLHSVLNGERPMPAGDFADQAAPLVKVISPQQGMSADQVSITIDAEVTDRGGGIDGPWLMQNGAKVITQGERKAEGKTVRQTFQVMLVEGENRFEVRAASADGSWESEPALLVVNYERLLAKPSVHLVSIGVNQYAEETMNLKFAAPDALAMAALFEARGPELYGQEQVHVTQVLNEQVTRKGIEDALGEVAKKAQPQDTLVVFLAGHGTTLGQRYYFIPHDFQAKADKVEDDIREQGIAGDVLGDWVEKVPALKRVLIFDTCQSGTALPVSRTTRDPFAFRGALERLSHSRGFFTIAASAASESAQEILELKHGMLTYALLAGAGAVEEGPLANQPIKATADDKTVEVREWFSFAQDKVPLLTKLYVGEEQFIGFSGQGASFPVLPAKEY